MVGWMDPAQSPAEMLPQLYRAVLDRVADLERVGERAEAVLMRAEATSTYSRSWDEAACRRLILLCRRADRVIAGVERPRTARPIRGLAVLTGRGRLLAR